MVVPAATVPAVQPGSQHFRDLDGLRGVLALSVVLLHFGFNSFAARTLGWPGFRFELAVDVFFLLSGYVLTYAVRGGVSKADFAIKRFIRLAPVFYVTTALTLLSVPDGWHPAELAMAMPMTGNDPVNSPAWSVCWEIYLPVLAVLVPVRVPDRMVRPLLVIALLALGIADTGVAEGERLYLLRAACGLAAGHLLYRANLSLTWPLVPLFAALGLIMALAMQIPASAIALPFVASLCILAGRNGGTLFAAPPFQLLGHLSYTLYLAHIPVLRAMQHWLRQGVIDGNPLAKVAGLGMAFVLAGLLTMLIERPAMRWGQRWLRGRGRG